MMTGKKITNAVLLAAGYGTRLKPLTNTLPKPLLPLNGFTSLDYGLRFLKRGGIETVVINLHHLGDTIRAHVGDGRRYELKVRYSEEPVLFDTGGGVKQAAKNFTNEPFVVLNSVVLIDVDLGRVIDHHFTTRADATMVLRRAGPADNFTKIRTDGDGWVREFGTKGDFFFTGLHIVGPRLLSLLPTAGTPACMIKQGYEPLIAGGGRVASYLHNGYWNKVETPERYAQIQKDVAAKKVTLP